VGGRSPCPLCGRVFDRMVVEGREIVIRGACPDDKEKLVRFYERLSAETIYTRFFSIVRHFDPYVERLLSSAKSLVVVAEDAATGDIVGMAELIVEDSKAEGGIVVLEDLQGKGIGSRLAEAMRVAAVEHGIEKVYGYVLPDNVRALKLVKKLGGRVVARYPSMLYVEVPVRG